ncbi:hypothetical protein RIF29_29169 [Crotalaria pallida]|uniref:SWIM-type domain-containing protein n=1 Tax=Crotalaria pallida TaxID=3830 RepID=A0AAN9EJ96_CROPI
MYYGAYSTTEHEPYQTPSCPSFLRRLSRRISAAATAAAALAAAPTVAPSSSDQTTLLTTVDYSPSALSLLPKTLLRLPFSLRTQTGPKIRESFGQGLISNMAAAIIFAMIGAWTNALKTLPLASQETSAALEFYHAQLKIRLLNEKDSSVYQRADWLVDKLGTKVHSYFWLDEYTGRDDFARYWKNEWMSGLTSWRKALKIPKSDVLMEDECAKVTDQHDRDKSYVVWNPGSMFNTCSCSWAQDGNLCEHILKVISICRKRVFILPSISLLQYHQTLNNMLRCPPFDSLIRDHAMSLAVSETSKLVSAKQDENLPSKRLVITQILSHDGDGHEDVSESPGCAMGDTADRNVDQGSSRNHIPLESAGEDSLPADMDVDPSTICISPPGLYLVAETVSNNEFQENKERALTTIGNEISATKNDDLFDHKIEQVILDKDCKVDVMDVDPPAFASSTTDTLEHCEPHQNGVTTVISCSKNADSHISNIPHS